VSRRDFAFDPFRIEDALTRPGAWSRQLQERQFLTMVDTFGRVGGLVSGDAFVQRRRLDCWGQDLSTLARWIVERQVLSIHWSGDIWIPLFQFECEMNELRRDVALVVQELLPVFDAWEMALWFATPNCWTEDKTPSEVIRCNPLSVLDAARADRFIASGW